MNGERNIVVRAAAGAVADISTYDVVQSNGVIHVVDRVLLPSFTPMSRRGVQIVASDAAGGVRGGAG
jgi:hypothetical protein